MIFVRFLMTMMAPQAGQGTSQMYLIFSVTGYASSGSAFRNFPNASRLGYFLKSSRSAVFTTSALLEKPCVPMSESASAASSFGILTVAKLSLILASLVSQEW